MRQQRGRMLRGRLLKVSELVAQQILLDIADRGLEPGDRLPNETEMIEAYGVSRSTLRESLRILEVGGLIQLKTGPKGGPRVRRSDPADLGRMTSLYLQGHGISLGEVLDARRWLEVEFLREAMRSPTPTFVEAARELHARGEAIDLANDEAYLSVTGDFHALVSSGSQNLVLTAFARSLMSMFVGEVERDVFPQDERTALLAEHQQVLAAIVAGEGERAVELMRAHADRMVGGIRSRQSHAVASVIRWR